MEVPIDHSHSIVISPSEITDIHNRYRAQVVEWAPEPNDLRYTILTNLQKTYKRISGGKSFERMTPWVAESIILLYRNGVSIPATLLVKAGEHQKRYTTAGTNTSSEFKSIKTFLGASLHASKSSQLAELIASHFLVDGLVTDLTHTQRTRISQCMDALSDSVIDSNEEYEQQTIKRMVWGVVVANIRGECTVNQTRDRLVKRCETALLLLDNIIEQTKN